MTAEGQSEEFLPLSFLPAFRKGSGSVHKRPTHWEVWRGGKSITFVKISDHDMTSKELDEKIKWNVQSSIKLDLYPYNSLLVFLLGLLQKKKLVITKYIIVLKRRNFRKSVVLQQWIGVDATVVQRQSGHRHRKTRLLGCLCCFSKWMSGGRNSAKVETYYSH